MFYEIGDFPREMLAAIGKAEDQVARLDEVVRRSPVREGFIERSHFFEAVASMWVTGELVHVEDLVLHDAERDVRAPTHDITIAHTILRTRRRIAGAEADWAMSQSGIDDLIGRPSAPADRKERGEGARRSFAVVALDEEHDGFAAEMAEIDALLDRSARTLESAAKSQENKAGSLAVGELIVRDPDWDEGGRISEWRAVMQEVSAMPPTLGAAIIWDAWETLEPLQRQHWLGAQLVNAYLRSRGKVSSHLFGLNFGLKAVPRERRRSRDRTVRLLAGLEAMADGAELSIKEIIRLGQVRDRFQRKLQGKRSSSNLPRLAELLIARPIVSASVIMKELKVSHRGALNLVAELGVREVTGRDSFRAWGVI
ncbi:RHE_PE00001 family protein [Ensifer sp. BR816]|uniref:RHE_PE00001 family protein n=1 Tax=Rhizobium sp. (strain BR816) TaxID=1057002 RepID=UPI0004767584|nr:RHE_PE00001 family protein [Ensifer sp. BR816]